MPWPEKLADAPYAPPEIAPPALTLSVCLDKTDANDVAQTPGEFFEILLKWLGDKLLEEVMKLVDALLAGLKDIWNWLNKSLGKLMNFLNSFGGSV